MKVLPELSNLPFQLALGGGLYSLGGGLYYLAGKIWQTNVARVSSAYPGHLALAAVISILADHLIFFVIASQIKSLDNKIKVYMVTNTLVGLVEIVAMRQLKLIAMTGTAALLVWRVWQVLLLSGVISRYAPFEYLRKENF